MVAKVAVVLAKVSEMSLKELNLCKCQLVNFLTVIIMGGRQMTARSATTV